MERDRRLRDCDLEVDRRDLRFHTISTQLAPPVVSLLGREISLSHAPRVGDSVDLPRLADSAATCVIHDMRLGWAI